MFTKTNTNISTLNVSVQECLLLYKDNIDYSLHKCIEYIQWSSIQCKEQTLYYNKK